MLCDWVQGKLSEGAKSPSVFLSERSGFDKQVDKSHPKRKFNSQQNNKGKLYTYTTHIKYRKSEPHGALNLRFTFVHLIYENISS